MSEKKSYYEIQCDALNSIEKIEDKLEYVKKIDFKNPIEKDSDANIISEIKMSEEGWKEKLIKSDKKFSFSMEEIIDSFLEANPIFYDKSKMLWRWNKEKCFYEQIDVTDLRISISEARKQGVNIRKDFIDLILERARLKIPENPKNTWIQFQNKILDYATGEEFEANPKYFITNPLPYEMGESEDTPKIDKLFTEWVGERYKENLYEIIAATITLNQFMQRIFALVGGGSNGKGTFIDLIQRAIGKQNYIASELRLLSEKNFETSCLYKKLLCVIGEVGYDDLKNTNQIKKLTGEDEIRYEFKGKNIFSDSNTATIICLTNSLPATPDKSVGFYRRWLVIDFPNEFPLGKNPIDDIPEQEFKNLMRKCFNILKKLWKTRKFTNEGDFSERIRRYEEHSNPVLKFLEENFEEEPDNMLSLRDFCNLFNEYARKKHLRTQTPKQIGKILRDEGFLVGNRKIEGISAVVIMNIKSKTIKTIKTIQSLTDFTICNSTLNHDSNDSNNSNSLEKTKEWYLENGYTPEEIKAAMEVSE